MRAPDGYVCGIDHVTNRVQVARSVGGLPGPWEPMSAFIEAEPIYGRVDWLCAPVWRKVCGSGEQAMKKKCTCGTQIVGGLCSSWCDLIRPDETPPETERSAREDWIPPSVYNPGLLRGSIFSIPYTLGPLQPPQTLTFKPKPTPFGDGTNALDKMCACREYIMRPGVVYNADDKGTHGTRACCSASGQWTLAPPKP
jgi:hypothetical protein